MMNIAIILTKMAVMMMLATNARVFVKVSVFSIFRWQKLDLPLRPLFPNIRYFLISLYIGSQTPLFLWDFVTDNDEVGTNV